MGVITFMVVSGYPPFGGQQAELLQKIRTGTYHMAPERWRHVSRAGRDFVRKLLVIDPVKRMSAEEALKHEWMQGAKLNLKSMSGLNLLIRDYGGDPANTPV